MTITDGRSLQRTFIVNQSAVSLVMFSKTSVKNSNSLIIRNDKLVLMMCLYLYKITFECATKNKMNQIVLLHTKVVTFWK